MAISFPKKLGLAAALSASLATLPAARAQVFGGAPSLAIGQQQLTVSGFTKGGQVLVAGTMTQAVGRVPFAWQDQAVLSDDDQDGVATWELPWPASPLAVFAAVDLATGYAGAVGGFEPASRIVALAAPVVVQDATGGDRRFSLAAGGPAQAVFLVRPGQGVWQGASEPEVSVSTDRDGFDNEAVVAALSSADLLPVGSTTLPAPPPLPGDVVLVLDPAFVRLSVRPLAAADFVTR